MHKKSILALITLALLVAGLSLNAAVTRTSTPGTAVPDATCSGADGAGGATDTIAFTEVSASISDVNVRVAFNHTWRGDLQFHVTYTGGGGTVVLAADDGGFPDNDYYATFDDAAGTACSAACGASITACSAVNAPGPTCSPDSALSAFNGLVSPGTWTLAFCDDAGADTGTLASWAVTANGQPGDGLPVELMEFGVQ